MSSHIMKHSTDVEQATGSAASVNTLNHTTFQKARPFIGNPSPAGIFAFAGTTLLLSMYNVGARSVHTPNVVLGMAIFSGGLLQFIAGMWQFPRGDVFSATVFACYGTFWMSWATIMIPSTGVLASYTDPKEFSNAMGLFLITWFILTILFVIPTLNRNFGFSVLLSTLAVSFLFLALGEFTQKQSFTRGGGFTGLVTAALAYYMGMSELLAAEARPIITLPQGRWYEEC